MTGTITFRQVDTPEDLDLHRIDPQREHWVSPGGYRAVRRHGGGMFHWRNEHGHEGTCKGLPLALTMLCANTPEMAHHVAVSEEDDAPSSEPAETGS